MKKVAVVILNWNGVKWLEKFLHTVVANSTGSGFECRVVVADNRSEDGSIDYIKSNFAPDVVELIELDKNHGFATGYNLALKEIQSDIFVILNSDVEPTQGWLEPIVELFESNSSIGAIQPKILSYHDDKMFEYAGASGGFIDSLGYPFCRGRLINECEQDKGQYDDCRPIFWASGAALCIRSDVFWEVGGFDDLFFAHMEEIDLCWRLKRRHYEVYVEPRSVVKHVGAGTLPVWSPRKTYLNFRNNIAMLYKNLSTSRFCLVYFVRFGTDSLRMVTYLVTLKFSFASAIFRGHRDFWRARKLYKREPSGGVNAKGEISNIYRGSIVFFTIFGNSKFPSNL